MVEGGEPATEPLRLVHHHPGRLRVRAEVFVEAATVFERVRAALDSLPGIAVVEHNGRTGSVLVLYEPGLAEPDAILGVMADAAGLASVADDAALRAARPDPAESIVRGARKLDAMTHELTGGRADLKLLVPAVLASAAAYSFVSGKGPRLPRWDNLLWWSYSLFSDLHAKQLDRTR